MRVMKLGTQFNFKEAYTHGGSFHADDVFAAAMISIINPEIKITRVNRVPTDINTNDVLVFDIGGGKFDHHMSNKPKRATGESYASFGLLWEEYGHILCNDDEQVWLDFDQSLVRGIDIIDNGEINLVGLNITTISQIIGLFNTTWIEDTISNDSQFTSAVNLAKEIINRQLQISYAKIKAYDIVEKAIEESDSNYIILSKVVPWQGALYNSLNPKASKILYAIYPNREKGKYNIQCVPTEPGSFIQKKPLPEEWRGKSEEELKPFNLSFCHPSGFLAAAYSLQHAISAVEYATNH